MPDPALRSGDYLTNGRMLVLVISQGRTGWIVEDCMDPFVRSVIGDDELLKRWRLVRKAEVAETAVTASG